MPTLTPTQLIRVGVERRAPRIADDSWLVRALLVWSLTTDMGG
jgi:hypothetical protein